MVAQPHCHHASVLGWEADERLLARAGATVERVPGCCGLAGNFGMERGHYDVSVAVAKTHLLPAVRARPDAVVLADGCPAGTSSPTSQAYGRWRWPSSRLAAAGRVAVADKVTW